MANEGVIVDRMFEPVRGMHDILPTHYQQLATVRATLHDELHRWGYQMLELPVLERRELYLKKAGEELVGKLYDFVHHGRHLALRPEWTTSVLRAFLHTLQSEPLPVRLAYSGPVFRYERPQRTTYRQFTQVGVELIGAAPPLADAEIVQLACRGLQQVGVHDYSVTIGHMGIVRALLASLGLADRTTNLLLWNMERLRAGKRDAIKAQIAQSNTDELFDLGPLAALPDEQLEGLLLTMLRAVGLRLDNSTRPPEAIVARLVQKLRRDDPQPRVDRALQLLERLAATRGAPQFALEQLRSLFADEGVDPAPLDELQTILRLLGDAVPAERVVVDAGFGRGLHYYTGLLFEIDAADGLQLCGGGRYDDLIGSLGGRASVPAVGFAYGLERVAAAAVVEDMPAHASLLVMAEQPHWASAALQVAEQLRARGYIATFDVRGRSLQANLRDAAKRGAKAVVICDERAPNEVRWYDLTDRGEQTLSLSEIV
jgi:histidyl-tRNA synthetase